MKRPRRRTALIENRGCTVTYVGDPSVPSDSGLQMCAFHANILVLFGEGAIPVSVSIARAVKGEH